MALYPGAVFKPTTWGGRTPRRKGQRGILHVAVSGARSLPPWNGNTWHFYVAADGYCEQYVDSDFCAWASADANGDALSIETQGGLGSSAVLNAEPWTPAAMARLADIMRWANQTEGIPLELLPDSTAGRRGWGPHRLGITHSRGLGSVPGWRVPGGQAWSSVLGKECPGDTKVRQVPQIIEMARTGATGGDDMYEKDDRLIAADRHTQLIAVANAQNGALRAIDSKLDRVVAALEKLADAGGLDAGAAQVAGEAGGRAALRELGDKLTA